MWIFGDQMGQSVLKATTTQITPTVLELLGVKVGLSLFNVPVPFPRVAFVIISYLGLQDVVKYKPKSILSKSNYIATLFPVNNKGFDGIIKEIFSFQQYNLFNLLDRVGRKYLVIYNENMDVDIFNNIESKIKISNDMSAYVKAVQWINRMNFILSHFFIPEDVHQDNTQIKRYIKKIDNFINLIYKQAHKPTTLIYTLIPSEVTPDSLPLSFFTFKV